MTYESILPTLTLEEKCALLSGGTTFGTRALPKRGIPAILCSDGPHGLRKQAGDADHLGLAGSLPATCFPTAAAMANSWDTALAEEVGAALGEEAAGQGVSVLLGPGLNMKRDPLCGRNFEYFSEDPYVAGKMAAAYIRGIQAKGVAACPKHFAVNSQETRRMASDSILDERTLREIYLTGFEIAVKEGDPKTIMTSYNLINGVYANENEHLLRDILRGSWGFDGAVITDWGGSNDHALGVKYGSTLEMPAPGLGPARELIQAVKEGKITEQDVDDRAAELLRLIDQTYETASKEPAYDEDAHHALARKAAGECVVLLKNEDELLPLAAGTKVALIGDFAESPRYQGAGSSVVNPTRVDSLKDRIQDSGLACVGCAKGFDRMGKRDDALRDEAVALAEKADVVLLCMGLSEANETEGAERLHMRTEDNQVELLNAVAAVNPNVAVLFFSGSTVETPWLDRTKAFVYAGLGGQAGAGALLDVIEGKLNPSGKLTETWPMTYADTPAQKYPGTERASEYREGPYIGYRYYGTAGIPVRFPFGFGLSYTKYEYSGLRIDEAGAAFTVANTGGRAGTEIAQLYIAKKEPRVFRPKRELRGFVRVELEPGESKEVFIPFDERTFRCWNVKTNAWEEESGDYAVEIGASSEDIRLSGECGRAGTDAPAPYEPNSLPAYESADIRDVPDDQFAALLGHEIPECGKAKLDRSITFGELNRGRSPIFWLVWLVLTALKRSGEKKGKTDLNLLFVYNMPLRALAKMTGGMVDMAMVDGMVLELRGFWIIGLLWVIVSFVNNLIRNARMEARLK